MSGNPRSILLGEIEPSRIEAAVEQAGYKLVEGFENDYGKRYVVENSSGCHLGIVQVYNRRMPNHEDADVHPGARTSVHGSRYVSHVLEALAVEFGGFHRSSEDGSHFVFVEGRQPSALDLDDRSRLQLLLNRVVSPEASRMLVERIEADPDFGSDLVEAIGNVPRLETSHAPKI